MSRPCDTYSASPPRRSTSRRTSPISTSAVRGIDLATQAATHSVSVDGEAVDVDVTGDGEYVVVTVADGNAGRAVIFNRDLQPLGSVDLPATPIGLVTPR